MKTKINNYPTLTIVAIVLVIAITGILIFTSSNTDDQNLLTYLENKYYQSFEIDKEITYDEYLKKIYDGDYVIPEDDYIKAYTVYPEECPEYVFVVGEYKGTMGHFLLPGKEKVQFDTYDVQEYLEIIGETEETEEKTTEVISGITDDASKLILKYLENKYDENFVIKSEITGTLFGTNIHGGLYQIEYETAYFFSPTDSYSSSTDDGVITFAAGIRKNDDGKTECFDCYEEVTREKVPPYIN